MNAVLVFDIEFGGTESPEPVSLGWVFLDLKTGLIEGRSQVLIRPTTKISEHCSRLTGLTWPLLKREPPLRDVARSLIKRGLRRYPCVSYGNDYGALKEACEKIGERTPLSPDFWNAAPFLARRLGLRRPSLVGILEKLGLEFEGVQHDASWDAWNLAIVVREMFLRTRGS